MNKALRAGVSLGLAIAACLPSPLLAGLPGISVRCLEVDPDTPSTLYAGYTNGTVATSINGGADWTAVSTILNSSGDITEIEIDPGNTSVIYASGFTRGSQVAKSVDGGATWKNSRDPGNGDPFGTGFVALGITALEVDPGNSNIIYAGTRSTSVTGDVYRSVDGGLNWSSSLLSTSLIRDLQIDPATPTTIYVAARGGGVFKSLNGGTSWNPMNNGIAGQNAEAIAIDPSDPDTLYLGTSAGGIFKSVTGGGSWVQINTGLGTGFINGLVIDPNNTSIVYAANSVSAGGVFKTINGGAGWTQINTGLSSGMPATLRKPQDIEIDPVTSSSVYAATEDGVFKSEDAGANWTTPPPVYEPPSASDGGSAGTLYAIEAGDPINTFNGELYNEYFTDLDLGGPMSLAFRRYYGAHTRRNLIVGDLGSNWRHNFDARLNISGNTAKYISNRGRVTRFLDNGSGWEQQDNLDTPYQLVKSGAVDAVLYDPVNERIYTFDYTTSSVIVGKLVKVEDSHGNQHTLTYDLANAQLLNVSDGLGRTISFTYNADTIPKIDSASDGTRTVLFAYNDPIDSEYLTEVTDVNGGSTVFQYKDTSANADHALILNTTLPRTNVPFIQTFDSLGRVDSQTDALGNTTLLSYNGNDTTITDPLGGMKVHSYTDGGELIGSEDAASLDVSLGSDSTGRRNQIADRLGGLTSFDFDTLSGALSQLNNADGSSSSFSFSTRMFGDIALHDMTGITHADGTTESLVYDASGNLVSHTDQLGNTRSFTYNGNGQVLTATNKLGGTGNNTYNGDGTLDIATDPSGNATDYEYDALRRPNLVTLADASTIGFTYDDSNRILTRTNEDGNTTTRVYDANGNLDSVTDPLTHTTQFDYDDNDRLESVTVPLGGVTTLGYDELGRPDEVTDANTNTAMLDYDSRGRLAAWTDPLGETWHSSFNDESILASITDPLGNVTSFASDGMGRITQITSPLGNVQQIGYDVMGRVTSTVDALGETTLVSRDLRGRVSAIDLPGGIGVMLTRNALGQITTVTDPNNNNWDRGYDSAGRLVSITDPLGRSRTTTYDSRNRPAVTTFAGALGTRTNGYNGTGQVTGIDYSDGTTLNFTRDDRDRLISANSGGGDNLTRGYDDNGNIDDSNGIVITRDAGGRIESMALAAGKVVTYTYDADSRLASVADWDGGLTTFDYDAAGRLTGINRPNAIDVIKNYDDDGRLTGISEGMISSIGLTRDANGQIVSATRNLPTAGSSLALASDSASFDAAAQLESASYDDEGRLVADGADSYGWNLASQLESYTIDGNTVTHDYDALGRRISRTESAVTRDYVWNDALGLPSISVEMQGAVDRRYYVHTPAGALLYSIDAATDERRFYHFDEMGNTLYLTNDAGAVIGSYAYSPFGELTASVGGLDNPFTWQGQFGLMDEGNGLYYDRARFYDSRSRRFISPDPVQSTTPQEVNPYQYARNNPLRFVDVSGLDPEPPRGEHRSSYNGLGYRSDAELLFEVLLRPLFRFFEVLAHAFTYGNVPPDYLNAVANPLFPNQPRYAYRIGFDADIVILPLEQRYEDRTIEYTGTLDDILVPYSQLEAFDKFAAEMPEPAKPTPAPTPAPVAESKPKPAPATCDAQPSSADRKNEAVPLGAVGSMLFFMGVPPEAALDAGGSQEGMQMIAPPEGLELPDEPGVESIVPELGDIVIRC